MINRVIITGSGGMLGSALLDKIKNKKDIHIIAVSSQVEKLSEVYKKYNNITVVNALDEINDKYPSLCINCAFPRTQNGEALANAVNSTEKVIDYFSMYNCKMVINISSQSVYSQKGDVIQTEEDLVAPSSLYGMSKYAIEQIVRLTCTKHKMNYVNIRLGSLASEEFDQRMINRFYYKIIQDEEIYIDNGSAKVSYLHVDDASFAMAKLIDYIIKGYEVDNLYNLSNNDWILISDLASRCLDNAMSMNIGGGISRIKNTNKESDYNNVINSSKFYTEFKWKPQYSMNELIDDIFVKKSNKILKSL